MGWCLAPWAFTRFMRVLLSALRTPFATALPATYRLMQLGIEHLSVSIYLDDLLVILRQD